MARRNKPTDPAAYAKQAQERKDREREIGRLKAMGAAVNLDQRGHVVSAYRSNVFNLLLARGTITPNHHDAASRFAETWAAWKGLDGNPDAGGDKVDCGSSAPDRRALVTDRMIWAGREVADTLDALATPHAKLLTAFIVATVEEDRPMAWRGVVERELLISVRDKQTQAVVAMLDALSALSQAPKTQHRAAA